MVGHQIVYRRYGEDHHATVLAVRVFLSGLVMAYVKSDDFAEGHWITERDFVKYANV